MVGAKVCTKCMESKWPTIIHDIEEYDAKVRLEVLGELGEYIKKQLAK